MQNDFEHIPDYPLFAGIAPEERGTMLRCLGARVARYAKNEVILLAGDTVDTVGVGLVLSGAVQVQREDRDGKQTLLTELGEGELFAEVFACAGIAESPVTVIAADSAAVLHICYRKVITSCSSACVFHQRLIENMLRLMAQKNLMLNQKLELLSKRTTRERILLFLRRQGADMGTVTIPYNREELAAFLCVERSALSAELSKMQRDGLLRYTRNSFTLEAPKTDGR